MVSMPIAFRYTDSVALGGIMDCVLIIRPPKRPVARYQLYVYQTARGIYSAKESVKHTKRQLNRSPKS